MLLYSIHVDITTILLIYWIVTLCVLRGVGDVATHGIYSIDDDELCDDLEGGGSSGYEEEV